MQMHNRSEWPTNRLAEARAVIADVAHHSDHLIRLACDVLAQHGETPTERADAQRLLLVVEARRPVQRAIVQALRIALPRSAIIHHCANEVTEAGPRGAKRQAILVGMGVHAGFADLMVLCNGRVLFLELKAPKGRLQPAQEAFRDAVQAQGFGWALVRGLDDALGALADHGFTTRIAPAPRRAAP